MARTIKISDPFAKTVEQALEHAADPAWLGAHSPLAAPYFIGKRLPGNQPDTPAARGHALRDLLATTAETLPPDQRQLLDVSFFHRDSALNNTGVARALSVSETTYYRYRASAIEALAHEVNRAVLPPLRAEQPRTIILAGRDDATSACINALNDGRSVAISGPSGIGKTALAAAVASRWDERAFWFTLRPEDADPLTHFVFALGYFLRQIGQPNAWRQLVADGGTVHVPRVLGLLRHDVHEAAAQTGAETGAVLVCIDEVHLLRDDVANHAQLLHIVDALRDVAPLLLIGQRVDVVCDTNIALTGLSATAVAALAQQKGQTGLSDADCAAVQAATGGNPALIELALSLLRAGEPLADVLRAVAGASSIEPLLQRLWRRLSDDERAALSAVCVFRADAPLDAWPQLARAFDQLAARDLLRVDSGSISATPAVRAFVHGRLSDGTVDGLNLHAAEILAERGEYTEAAFHFVRGHKPEAAIWLWLNHHELEIGRGHAAEARELFAQVDVGSLDADTQRALAVLRAEQLVLAGDAEAAETTLSTQTWPSTHALTPWARQLMGDAFERQGRIDQAAAQYSDALLALDALQARTGRQAVGMHVKRGYLFINRMPDLAKARREADLALWRAHNFAGQVETESGHVAAARDNYAAALAIAQRVNDPIALARTHQHLGALNVRAGDADAAIDHLQQALRLDETIGDPMSKLFDTMNLASAFVIANRYDEALAMALDGLSLAQEMKHGFLVSGLSVTAGEASVYLRQLDDAERYAMACLREEEEVFRPTALMVLARVRQAQGDFGTAESLLKDAIGSAQDIDDKYAEADAWKALAEVRAQAGLDAREAGAQAEALLEQLGS